MQPNRFRGDLDVLRGEGFTIVSLPFDWQARLVSLFLSPIPENIPEFNWPDRSRKQWQRFLRNLLPALYEDLGVDVTLGAGINYWRDAEWGRISSEAGYPYVVMHRENLVTRPWQEEFYRRTYSKRDPFRGDLIVIHNQTMADILSSSGLASEDRLVVAGALRMDGFLERLQAQESKPRKLALLFSFTPGSGLPHIHSNWPVGGKGWQHLFASTHVLFARLALEKPDVEFRIKLKWGGDYKNRVVDVLRRGGLEPSAIPNLVISADGNPHDLILESRVVVAFSSTTILEAGIAGRHVVVPCFHEATTDEYRPYVHLLDQRDEYSFADTEEQYRRLIAEGLEGVTIDDAVMERRFDTFRQFVSPTTRSAARYREALDKMVARARAGSGPGRNARHRNNTNEGRECV